MLAGAAALALPGAASAQEIRDLDNEASVVRVFSDTVGSTPVVFTYTIPAGMTLTIDAVPTGESELDPVMTVVDLETGEIIAEDDDGGDGLASRAEIYSEFGQRIEITVSAYGFLSEDESYGPFELRLRESVREPVKSREVWFGSDTSGTLDAAGSHLFTIAGEEGQLLEVALVAEDDWLDPMLELYAGEGMAGEPVASNDDGGGGLNSLIRYVLPETGVYTIRAMPYGDSYGDYTLRVAEESYPVLQSPVQMIGLGERLGGRLGEGYESGSLDPVEISYELTPEAIEAIRSGDGEVTFNMTTPLFEDEDFPSAIDAFLELGFETPLGFASLMTDDDGGEGLNSRIAIDLSPVADEPGWLENLRVKASTIGGGGQYEIELVEGMQPVEQPYSELEEFEEIEPAPPIRAVPDADGDSGEE